MTTIGSTEHFGDQLTRVCQDSPADLQRDRPDGWRVVFREHGGMRGTARVDDDWFRLEVPLPPGAAGARLTRRRIGLLLTRNGTLGSGVKYSLPGGPRRKPRVTAELPVGVTEDQESRIATLLTDVARAVDTYQTDIHASCSASARRLVVAGRHAQSMVAPTEATGMRGGTTVDATPPVGHSGEANIAGAANRADKANIAGAANRADNTGETIDADALFFDCPEAVWTVRPRRHGLVIDLDVPRGEFQQAHLVRRPDGAVQLGFDLQPVATSWPRISRHAVDLLLLKASHLVRAVRPATTGREPNYRWEAHWHEMPSGTELHHALCGLSIAWRLTAREADVLRDGHLARTYLKIRA